MKKNEIKIGGQYTCKVSDRIVVVKITGQNPHGGWDAVNLTTNKTVRIKSAQRLRSAKFVDQKALAEQAASRAKGGKGKDKAKAIEAEAKAPEPEVPLAEPAAPHAAPVATGGDGPSDATTATTEGAVADTGEPGATGGKRMGLVSAAIQILKDGDNTSMGVKEMVEQVTAKGLWSPARGGKTPAASLYAAIFREIKQKGEASRFTQPDRGKFALKT